MRLPFPVPRSRRFLRPGVLYCGLVVAATLSGVGQVSAAVQDAPVQDDATEVASAPKVNKNGKICKTEDVTGSRMPKRVCYTPEQWEARQRAGRDAVRELDARSVGFQEGA